MEKNTCFQKILLADDGSEHARAAVNLLLTLPLSPETHVTILRIFGSQQASDLAVLETDVNAACDLLRARHINADPELLLGSPAEKIIEYSEQHHPDLIMMGAKGLRATLGILLGGVAQQVIEYAACPVMVIRSPMPAIKRILLVVDGSQYSQAAAECMVHFPYPADCGVTIMHVLPPHYLSEVADVPYGVPVREPSLVSEAVSQQHQIEEVEGRRLLDEIGTTLAGRRIGIEKVLARGDAATEIIDYVKNHEVDLIAAGSRGLSRMQSWLLGSVSRKLVHYSGCSVLIVRGRG
jgi:nucleotide-binding universal stress UspA family protein